MIQQPATSDKIMHIRTYLPFWSGNLMLADVCAIVVDYLIHTFVVMIYNIFRS